ncbi:hypothetical protein IE53DRAFT_31757 [Violaceomyces palustris]|uniref:Uncharacterized protein n=1 Tax=Violaceomyces palustris TaxID=1673888 RepID=A0ACD0P151_9BASI|nr:hypothetical protein IE53DRAFT_31757 [Violaceomyces palustris]
MAPSLQAAIDLVKSEKVKERQEGIQLYAHIFSHANNVKALDRAGDGKAWLKTFQSLFASVLLEKAACVKRGHWKNAQPAALSRLSEAAAAVRLLVERSVEYLNKKVIKALLVHLLQMLSFQGSLFRPVALDYLKSLRTLLQHRPHVSHIDPDDWASCVSTCFNITLGDDLSTELESENASFRSRQHSGDNDEDCDPLPLEPVNAARRQLSLQDTEQMICLEHLVSSPSAPLLGDEKYGLKVLIKYGRFLEDYPHESSCHLPALTGICALLRELELNERSASTRFCLRFWPSLVGLWSTKNRALKEQLIIAFKIALPLVSSSLPLAYGQGNPASLVGNSIPHLEVLDCLSSLHRLVLCEPSYRWGLSNLSLKSLCLRCSCGTLDAFRYKSFSAGRVLPNQAALIWAALELGADTIIRMHTILQSQAVVSRSKSPDPLHEEPLQPSNTLSTSTQIASTLAGFLPTDLPGTPRSSTQGRFGGNPPPAKRRRVEKRLEEMQGEADPISSILNELSSSSGRFSSSSLTEALWKLQLLLFMIERGWSRMAPVAQEAAINSLIALTSSEENDVQAWSLLCLAAVATCSQIQGNQPDRFSRQWVQAWNLAFRRLSNPSVARSAAHAAHVILKLDLVGKEAVRADLQTILSDLDSYGPSFPYDAVCSMLAEMLKRANNDVGLASHHFQERVMDWLQSNWSPVDGTLRSSNLDRTYLEDHDPVDVLQLFVEICRLPQLPRLERAKGLISSSAIVSHLLDERRSSVYREFLLNAEVAVPHSNATSFTSDPSDSSREQEDFSNMSDVKETTYTLQATERRIAGLLHKSLIQLAEKHGMRSTQGDPGNGYAESHTAEEIRHALDVAVLALLTEAFFSINNVRPPNSMIPTTSKLVEVLVGVTAKRFWSIADRALMLQGLQPILPRLSGDGLQSKREDLLLNAGKHSGIRGMFVPTTAGVVCHDEDVLILLKRIWQAIESQGCSPSIVSALRRSLEILAAEDDPQSSDVVGDDAEDEFGSIRQAQDEGDRSRSCDRDDDVEISTISDICIEGLVEIPRMLSSSAQTIHRDEWIVSLLAEGAIFSLVGCGQKVFRMVNQGRLTLSQRDITKIIERIGSDMLPSYQYGRQSRAQIVAIDFVQCTMSTWLSPGLSNSNLVEDVRKLFEFFIEQITRKKRRSHWMVKRHVARLLERYIISDPREQFWLEEQEPLLQHLPSEAIMQLGMDSDFRVRCLGAVLAPELFEILETDRSDPESLYVRVRDQLPSDDQDLERMASRIVCLSNITIASSSVRRLAVFHLIETNIVTGGFHQMLKSLLEAVSKELGFDHLRDLYNVLSGPIVWGLLSNNYDPLKVPASLLGYRTRKDCVDHTFKETGSMMLAAGNEAGIAYFGTLCKLSRKTTKEGILLCLPFLAASNIALSVEDHIKDRENFQANAWTQATRLMAELDFGSESTGTNAALAEMADQIVVTLLTLFYEPEVKAENGAIAGIKGLDGVCAKELSAMCSGGVEITDSSHIHEPSRPFFGAVIVYHSIKLLEGCGVATCGKETAYHVLKQMLSLIYKTRFVNEQLRYVCALKLYVSMCAPSFRSSPVLITELLHGASILVSQVDLVGPMTGLASWAFDCCLQLDTAPRRTTAIIVTIVAQASAFSDEEGVGRQPADKIGERLLTWIEKIVTRMLECDSTRVIARDALIAWPRTLSSELESFVPKKEGVKSLTDALRRADVPVTTSVILDRLRFSFRNSSARDKKFFSSATIWLLLKKLKLFGSPTHLLEHTYSNQAALSKSVAEIFYACEGRLQTPNLEGLKWLAVACDRYSPVLDTIASMGQQDRALQAVVVLRVLDLLRGRDLKTAEEAFNVLRTILSCVAPSVTSALPAWPDSSQVELNILSAYPSPANKPIKRFDGEMTDPDFLVSCENFETWICLCAERLCHYLTWEDDHFYAQVGPLSSHHAELASQLLPVLIHAVAIDKRQLQGDKVQEGDQDVLEKISTHFENVLKHAGADRRCWATIVECFLHLRKATPMDLEGLSLLSIDYLDLARRALDCQMFTSCILFVELWMESDKAEGIPNTKAKVSNLLYEAYSNVEDPDGFYGIENPDIRTSLVQRLHHEGQWHRAFDLHAADYESTAVSGILGNASRSSAGSTVDFALHKMGFNRLAALVEQHSRRGAQGRHPGTGSGNEPNYDIAWRTGAWDLPANDHIEAGTSARLFSALQALHRERKVAAIDKKIVIALACEVKGLRDAHPEAMAAVQRVGKDLLGLREVDAWRKDVKRLGVEEALHLAKAKWTKPNQEYDFESFERVLAVRQSILRSGRIRMQAGEIGDIMSPVAEDLARIERGLLLQLSEGARRQGKLQTSINAVTQAQQLQSVLRDGSNLVSEEFACVLWDQGEHAIAIRALEAIISMNQAAEADPLESIEKGKLATLMARLGKWRATARSQKPQDIDHELFVPAIGLVSDGRNQQSPVEQAIVSYEYATFADDQYKSLSNTPEMARLKLYIERRSEELRQNQAERAVASSMERKQELAIYSKTAEKILRQDKARLQELTTLREDFMRRAALMYSHALALTDEYDDALMRLVSIWFENSNDQMLNEAIAKPLANIPSYKFVGLTHQLSARLSRTGATKSKTDHFQGNLMSLMIRVCTDHPFHSLYPIFALRKAGEDSQEQPSTRGRSRASLGGGGGNSSASQVSSQVSRSTAAEEVFDTVKSNPKMTRMVREFEDVCRAYAEWAELNLEDARYRKYHNSNGSIKKGILRMPPEISIGRLRSVGVPVATAELPVDPTGRYQNLVTIERYSESFTTAGGINLPKISECIGSDGKRYKQLFKRKDDLRQDAVMQQVFRVVNVLLSKDRRARQRQLKVRTYAVIPLGPQCGLLEFVGNTVPLGEVLFKMHERYRPRDISALQARTMIRDATDLTAQQKLDVFLDVCEKFQPAFRHFFHEMHKSPQAWYAMRLNYTRSVSTTSISGHVLGLGDRHVSNILLDRSSGELVHIDFGIAFDQGKLLRIPELVPFRLTRDLVDGMGLSGVDGVFRRCCEETLRVLRDGGNVVKTILEVFKHDPLFTWASNPIKILKAQGAGATASRAPSQQEGAAVVADVSGKVLEAQEGAYSNSKNQAALDKSDTAELSADRAVSSVMEKLSPNLSVEYTVNELISQAMDAGNLSAIFHGWQAAL